MTRIMLIVTAGLLAVALACGKEATPTAKPAASAPAGGVAAAAINANCPVMGEPIKSDAGTTSFKGHTVGFCCAKCSAKFNALDDAGKIAALEKAGTKLPE